MNADEKIRPELNVMRKCGLLFGASAFVAVFAACQLLSSSPALAAACGGVGNRQRRGMAQRER